MTDTTLPHTICVTLPDSSNKKLKAKATGFDLARSISEGLFQKAIGLEIDGELKDLSTVLKDQSSVRIITQKDEQSLEILRHSTAHVLACAVQSLFPEAKIATGPTIEDGFYYDFYLPNRALSTLDLLEIETKMLELIQADLKFSREEIADPNLQIENFQAQGEQFKAQLLEKYKQAEPSQYFLVDQQRQKIWSDLCKGPHLQSSKQIKAFKLLSVSSAYWQADEKQASLQRIYGTAWWSKQALKDYLERKKQAEARDHRKLSKEHEFFSIHEEAGPGLIFWHPKLGFLRSQIEQFWKEIHTENDYQIIYTPHIAKKELWEISGHEEYYAENMFRLREIDQQEYVLKPMNCPFHVLVFNSRRHSYRELPVRLAEMGTVYRFERSGALHGLARVRGFTQDDAHVFCQASQLVTEVCQIIDLTQKIYQKFNLEYTAELSTRPLKSIGAETSWQMAETSLKKALEEKRLPYEINEGDGAFYGPKIDFKLKDAIGRTWQGATVQVDFNLPERFDLKFTNSAGEAERPVMLHRAIFGSLERFTALLIEHYAGAFPLWLSEKQVIILPIADRHNQRATEILEQLKQKKIRAKIDQRAEKINAKIRDAQLEQIPYMLVLGDKEIFSGEISVRERRKGKLGSMTLEDFLKKIQEVF